MVNEARECPYLTPVVADRLWLYPVSAYCRRPHARLRVPAPATLANVCTEPEHAMCAGYLAALRQSREPTPAAE